MSKSKSSERSTTSEMKVGWQTATLSDVLLTLKNGFNCKQDKNGFGDRVSRIESISSGVFDLSKVGFTSIPDQDKEKFKLQLGDILFSHINSPVHVGKTAIFDLNEEVYHGVNLLLMRPVSTLISEYLRHYLNFLYFRGYWKGVCKQSVNQASVNQQDICRVPVMFPTRIEEQERIVAILDQAFQAIATAKTNAEMNLVKTIEFFDGELQLLITPQEDGWNSLTLAEIASDFGRGKSKHRPRNDPKLYGGSYPFIQTGDVRNAKQFVNTYSQTYNDVGLKQSKLWPRGTLCVTIAANIAETAILDFDACFPDSVIGIVANPSKANTRFIDYRLRAAKSKLQAKGKGSAQDNINLGTFEGHTFLFPPLSIQEALVERLDSVASLLASLTNFFEQKLVLLDELKQSLLYQAFSGNL